MSNRETEKRVVLSKFSLRTSADGHPEVSGLAAAYGTISQDLGGFVETIAPGAFRKVVVDPKLDCRLLVNHEPSQILGRTKSGTLKVWADEDGLRFRCQLPDTTIAKDIRESIKRGDIDQCSFSFRLADGDDSFAPYTDVSGKRTQLRTIRNFAGLYDVSAVTYPAYAEGTSVSARSAVAYDLRAYMDSGAALRVRVRALSAKIALDDATAADFDYNTASPEAIRTRARLLVERIQRSDLRNLYANDGADIMRMVRELQGRQK